MAIINVSAANGMAMANAAVKKGSMAGVGIAGDSLLFDGADIITYRIQGTKVTTNGKLIETGAASYAIPRALRREVSRRELFASGGRFRVGDTVFEIAKLELATRPREGDHITSRGERWSVLACDESTLSTRWRVFARVGA